MHTELISFSATAPGAGGAAAAGIGTDSLVIKNSKQGAPARILALWMDMQADGYIQLITPSAHDTTRGWRQDAEASFPQNLLPWGIALDVQPQETMALTIAGSATAGDVESGGMLVHYDDLPGTTQRAITWAELVRRTEKLLTINVTLDAVTAGYSASELINAESDLLKANRDYAVIGFAPSVQCATIALRGPDTGNVRIGGPGNTGDSLIVGNWFAQLARSFDMPLIPVINSGNKNSTYLDCIQDENVADVTVSLQLALLTQ